jgi:hypothetical protein
VLLVGVWWIEKRSSRSVLHQFLVTTSCSLQCFLCFFRCQTKHINQIVEPGELLEMVEKVTCTFYSLDISRYPPPHGLKLHLRFVSR